MTEVSLTEEHDRWQVEVAERGRPEDPERHTGRNLDPHRPRRPPPLPARPRGRVAGLPLRQPPRGVRPGAAGGARRRSRSSEEGRAPSAPSSSSATCGPQARLTIYTPTLPLSRGESFLENRVFADPDNVGWEHIDVETRRDFVKHCDRGVFDQTVLERIADDDHLSFVTGRAIHVSLSDDGEGAAAGIREPLAKACRASATTSSSTAPASTFCASCAASSPTPSATRSKNSAARSGTARRRPRSRSVAASSWKGCGRGCTSPASAACARARASPTSAASACSPTACCNHCSPN